MILRCLSVIAAVAMTGITGAGEPAEDQTGLVPYPEAPEFTVHQRDRDSRFSDCSRCHDPEDSDPEPRKLRTRHIREIDHGSDRFWCMTCHDGDNIGYLRSSGNEILDFDQSYLVCGSCHADRQRDWFYGGHGKRVSGWHGERVILACTECHDPHAPSMKPRKPAPPPPVRTGLERPKHNPPATPRAWEP